MPPIVEKFSRELVTIGAVLLTFLLQLFAQQLWNRNDQHREALAGLATAVSTNTMKIESNQRQVEEQSVLLRQLVESNNARDTRIARLEMSTQHTAKLLDENTVRLSQQFSRLENQIADVQRLLLQRPSGSR